MEIVFMKRALELAKKGVGFTFPNPAVGAVIVKGGKIVGEGWHKKAGEDHAEIVAIKEVMRKSGIRTVEIDRMLFHNATLYVTLEPCCHQGKTGPCVEAIVQAGFQKVYIGMKDPFKKVNGKGINYLKKKGVKVEILSPVSALAREIRQINQPFIKWAVTSLPYVVLKAGISLDGKITDNEGNSKWITGNKARFDARIERGLSEAIVVGASTVFADNPELAADGKFRKKTLLRVIIDRKLSADLKRKVFRDENVLIACTDLAKKTDRKRCEIAGIKLKSFGKKEISVKKLLSFLGKMGIQSVFVEGGSKVHGMFVDAALGERNLVDQVLFYVAPKLIGGSEAKSVIGGNGVRNLKKTLNLAETSVESIGEDLKVRGVINFY